MTKLILATLFLLAFSTAALAGPFGGYIGGHGAKGEHFGGAVSHARP